MCVEACNFDAIRMGHDYEMASYDRQALTDLVTSCEVTTYDIEHCDTSVLAELEARGHRIVSSPRLLQTIQDKVLQKELYLKAGVPVAPFVDRGLDDLKPSDFPVVQKARSGGYDGRGVVLLRSASDLAKALPGDCRRRQGSYLEAAIPFVKELGVMVARSATGQTEVYPVTEMVFDPELNICTQVIAPADLPASTDRRARDVAVSVVEALGGVGVFGVELFLTVEGSVIVNEVAPRPHNSGHYTMEACRTCQFENHLRAVAGLPLGDPGFHSPAVMVNLLGQGAVGPTLGNAGGKALDDPVRAPAQRGAHGLGQIRDLGGQLHHQALLLAGAQLLDIHPAPPVAHEPRPGQGAVGAQQAFQGLQVDLEVAVQEGFPELFLGFEVIVEGTLGHPGRTQQFGQAHGCEPPALDERPAGIQQMLSNVALMLPHDTMVPDIRPVV